MAQSTCASQPRTAPDSCLLELRGPALSLANEPPLMQNLSLCFGTLDKTQGCHSMPGHLTWGPGETGLSSVSSWTWKSSSTCQGLGPSPLSAMLCACLPALSALCLPLLLLAERQRGPPVRDTDFGGRLPGLNPSTATQWLSGPLASGSPSVKWVCGGNGTSLTGRLE